MMQVIVITFSDEAPISDMATVQEVLSVEGFSLGPTGVYYGGPNIDVVHAVLAFQALVTDFPDLNIESSRLLRVEEVSDLSVLWPVETP